MLPVARKRFGSQPVAIEERVARHMVGSRSSHSKTILANTQPAETLAEPSGKRAEASRGKENAPRNPLLSRGDVVVVTGVMSEPSDPLKTVWSSQDW